MSQNPASDTEYFKDHLFIRHADNPPNRFTLPSDENAVTRIGRDQIEDYAARKGFTLAETERWLGPYLDYTP